MDKQKAFEAALLKEAEVAGQSGMQASATDLRVSPCVLDNGDVIYINPVVQACWWAYRQGLKAQAAAAAEAMRPSFEKAVIERLKEGGYLEVEIRVECLSRDGEGYYDGSVNAYWQFYKQSRTDLVVTLPAKAVPNQAWSADAQREENARASSYNLAIRHCRQALEAAGGTVSGADTAAEVAPPSYHDVVVFAGDKRLCLFDSSYGLQLHCTRVAGWQLWNVWDGKDELLAGEYNPEKPIRVEVRGVVICETKPSEGDAE